MTSQQTTGSFPSMETAKTLLAETKALRQSWAGLAVSSAADFTAFREDGAAFPEPFLEQYQQLNVLREQLATRIRTECRMVPADQWAAPSPEQSLRDFERRLEELRVLCREAEKRAGSKREASAVVLESIGTLKCSEASVTAELANIQQQAEADLARLHSDSAWVMTTDHDQHLEPLRCLLKLVADADARYQPAADTPAAAETTSAADTTHGELSWDECLQAVQEVQQAFGQSVVVAVLRGRLTAPNSATTAANSATSATASTAVPVPGVTAAPAAQLAQPLQPATKEQLASLVDRFNRRPPAPTVVTGNPDATPVAPPVPEAPVSDADLLQAANRLRGRATNLWQQLVYPYGSETDCDPDRLRAIGYLNLAQCIDLALEITTERARKPRHFQNEMHGILRLFAEAQNAVRTEREQSPARPAPLVEQTLAFRWLKHRVSEPVEAVPIERFMKREEAADPTNNQDVARRLRIFEQSWKATWKKEACLAELEQAVTTFPVASPTADDWRNIDQKTVELLKCGTLPNDSRLRTLLLPIAEAVPEDGVPDAVDLSPGMQRVFESIEDFFAAQVHQEPEATAAEISPQVVAARRLLSGQKVAIIGGVPVTHARERLQKALGLKKLKWIAAGKTDRVGDFESKIRDVALVILITKIIGHKHNDVRELCVKRKIPWVQTKISSGYGVNQIAALIMEQASRQLQEQVMPGSIRTLRKQTRSAAEA